MQQWNVNQQAAFSYVWPVCFWNGHFAIRLMPSIWLKRTLLFTYKIRLHYTAIQKTKKKQQQRNKIKWKKRKEKLMKLFKTKSILCVFVIIQSNITIIKINTINIINIERNSPKVLLYNLKTLKFSPAKSILLQFLSLNTKLLINTFLIQKTDLRKKGNKEDFLLPSGYISMFSMWKACCHQSWGCVLWCT